MTTNANKQSVSTDMQQVKELLDKIPENRQPIAQGLYNELLFMQQTMATLKEQVQNEGGVSLFRQGAQEFLREHPALTAYNKTIAKYSAIYKQLIDLLPEGEEEDADELLNFVNNTNF